MKCVLCRRVRHLQLTACACSLGKRNKIGFYNRRLFTRQTIPNTINQRKILHKVNSRQNNASPNDIFQILGKSRSVTGCMYSCNPNPTGSQIINNFAQTFIRNVSNLKHSDTLNYSNYRRLIKDHLKNISHESQISRPSSCLFQQVLETSVHRCLPTVNLLNWNPVQHSLVKLCVRCVSSKQCELNPKIACYRQMKNKQKLCKQCDPRVAPTPFWKGWVEGLYSYFSNNLQVKAGKTKGAGKTAMSNEDRCKSESKYKNDFDETNRNVSQCKDSSDADTPCYKNDTHLMKSQRKILYKKICNRKAHRSGSSSSSIGAPAKKLKVATSCIQQTRSKDLAENCESPKKIMLCCRPAYENSPSMETFYLLTCHKVQNDYGDSPNETMVCKMAQSLGGSLKMSHKKSNATYKVRPDSQHKKSSKDKLSLYLTCKHLRDQLGIPHAKDKRPKFNRKKKQGSHATMKNQQIPELSKKESSWHDDFDKSELLTCKNLKMRALAENQPNQTDPCKEDPCKQEKQPSYEKDPWESDDSSLLNGNEQPCIKQTHKKSNRNPSANETTCKTEELDSQPAGQSSYVSNMEKEFNEVRNICKSLETREPNDSLNSAESVRCIDEASSNIAASHGHMTTGTESNKFPPLVKTSPGENVNLPPSNAGKRSFTITDVKLRKGARNKPESIMLKIRIKIPLSKLGKK